MIKNFQMVSLGSNNTNIILHPETNADQVKIGTTYEVPTKTAIVNWNEIKKEVEAARKGAVNLKTKIDGIDLALEPLSLLEALKTVDSDQSGLNCQYVTGVTVDDTKVTNKYLWTADKVGTELQKKVNNTLLSTSAAPRSIILTNGNGDLPINITGIANSASALTNRLTINFTGDVTGSVQFSGNEGTVQTSPINIKDDSHAHTSILGPNNTQVKVNDTGTTNADIWSALKTASEISEAVKEVAALTSISENEIVIDGKIRVMYGTVAIGGDNRIEIQFPKTFNQILFDNITLESKDALLTAVRNLGTLTKTGVSYTLNKVAPSGSFATWFAVGR